MISVDELRAAGALDVPPSWRKTLGPEPKLATGLFDDDDLYPAAALEPPADESAEDDD